MNHGIDASRALWRRVGAGQVGQDGCGGGRQRRAGGAAEETADWLAGGAQRFDQVAADEAGGTRSPESQGCVAEGDFSEIALRDGAGMLGVDLEPQTLHARRRFSVGFLVIVGDVVGFGNPAVQVGRAGLADHGKNPEEGNGAGVLEDPFGSGGIPDVGEHAVVAEGDQDLSGLVVGAGAAKIAAYGKPRDLPLPVQERGFGEVDVEAAFESEGGFDAFEAQAARLFGRAYGNEGGTAVDLELPAEGQAAAGQVGGVEDDDGELRRVGRR